MQQNSIITFALCIHPVPHQFHAQGSYSHFNIVFPHFSGLKYRKFQVLWDANNAFFKSFEVQYSHTRQFATLHAMPTTELTILVDALKLITY